MRCNYCNHDLVLESGLLNSSEDSPMVTFWHCENCKHDFMDEEQEKELKKITN